LTTSHVVLRDVKDSDGSRLLEATLTSEGDLVIEGWDFGAGVERIFGVREYEWVWTIPYRIGTKPTGLKRSLFA